MTRFVSTRATAEPVPFATAVLHGLAPDGGLYIPQQVPSVGARWREIKDFRELSAAILEAWIGSHIGSTPVRDIIGRALDFEVPIVRLAGGDWNDVLVVELFHGPTLSFKDFGARCMAGFMAAALPEGEKRTVLVATSGDTGSAVADGFAGQDAIRVVLLYPRGQVSPVQERQLIVRRPGVMTLAVDGSFDDCQRMVKEAFAVAAPTIPRLSSANSINAGRLLPQMVYYYRAAAEMRPGEFRCCVPSGNLGNLTAGVFAHLSGIRAARFIAAHNANQFFPHFLSTGEKSEAASVRTLSNAMDVGVPSNFERLVRLLDRRSLVSLIWGTSVSDADTLAAIRRVREKTGYVADPHTAVGLEAVSRYRKETGDSAPMAVMATAHPAKFPETIEQALGHPPEVPARLERYWKMSTQSKLVRPRVDDLLQEIV